MLSSKTTLPIVLLTGLSILLFVPGVRGDGLDSQETAKELLATVLAGIEHNYSQISAFKAKLRRESDRPWATRLKVNKLLNEKDTNAKITLIAEPHSVFSAQFVARNSDLRFETEKPDTITCFANAVFTVMDKNEKVAWKRRPSEMPPALLPYDPRDIGVISENRSLVQVLREDRLIGAKTVTNDKGIRVIQVQMENPRSRKVIYEFDPAISLLPRSVVLQCADGSTNVHLRIDYQNLLSGSAWFPLQAVCKIYPPGVTRGLDSEGWSQIDRLEVLDLVLVDPKEIPDATFVVEFPNGTTVHDNLKERTVRVDDHPGKGGPTFRSIWLLIASAITVISAIVWKMFVKR